MPKLLKAYDSYGDLEPPYFFTFCYDAFPSSVKLNIRLRSQREKIEAVLAAVDMNVYALNTVYKNWRTDGVKNPDPSKDFPFQHLLKSDSHKLLVWIDLSDNSLSIDCYYDLADTEVEAWVLATCHRLRTEFAEERTHTFKVLARSDRQFYTEDVNTGDFSVVAVDELYNDDFQEIDSIICESMGKSEAGLILLHGEPGTGKTSYIKNLICKFQEKVFIFIQNEFVQDLLKPEFISFLLKHRDAVLIIEDAEKVIISREHSSEGSVVSTILQLTDGLFSDYLNIKIICTFNTGIDKVDKALVRKGRLIAKYEFKPLTAEKTAKLLQSLGYEAKEKVMTLADIFKLKHKDFNGEEKKAKIGF